jgi:hypothetical protein
MDGCAAKRFTQCAHGQDGEGCPSAYFQCDLWADHKPPIHWDKAAAIHWFLIEEQPGYEPGTSLDYEPSGS